MTQCTISVPVLALHVKKGYEDRAEHVERMLGNRNIPFTYILDGDKSDLTDEVLDKYFVEEMRAVTAPTSCAMKHLLAYEHIVNNGLPGAIILEDDMILYSNFERVFNKCMQECRDRGIDVCMISFEDSILKFVDGSKRNRGQYLYPAKRDRFTGCYYISASCARIILDYVKENKCNRPIDVLHSHLISEISLPYYWSHPTIATQGSHCGLFASSISQRSAKKHLYRKLTWKIKRFYKLALYRFR